MWICLVIVWDMFVMLLISRDFKFDVRFLCRLVWFVWMFNSIEMFVIFRCFCVVIIRFWCNFWIFVNFWGEVSIVKKVVFVDYFCIVCKVLVILFFNCCKVVFFVGLFLYCLKLCWRFGSSVLYCLIKVCNLLILCWFFLCRLYLYFRL